MGHVFLGWGSEPCFSEFKRDGFETRDPGRHREPCVAVQALDAGARVMATSRTIRP